MTAQHEVRAQRSAPKGFRRTVAGLVAALVATGTGVTAGARPVSASECQRSVIISPQVSASEFEGTLVFGVHSAGCAAAGEVSFQVTPGTATPGADYKLANGRLQWRRGDSVAKAIVATLVDDAIAEASIETFTVTLTDPSPDVVLVAASGVGRILDDDAPERFWVLDDVTCRSPGPTTPTPSAPAAPAVAGRTVAGDLALVIPPVCGHGKEAFKVTVNIPLSLAPMTATASTVDGTARAGIDYVPVTNGVLTVPAGATHGMLPVRLLPRPPGTPRRWFYVRIAAVSSGTAIDPVAVVTVEGP